MSYDNEQFRGRSKREDLRILGLVEVRIETPEGRIARGRARRDQYTSDVTAIQDAFDDAFAHFERLSGDACDCGVYAETVKGLHHMTTCAMFRQDVDA